jgi:hypothetical protein
MKLRRAGVVTTPQVKERMRIDLQRLLREDSIRLCDPFVSTDPDTRHRICDELKNYRFEVKPGKEGTDQVRKSTLTP